VLDNNVAKEVGTCNCADNGMSWDNVHCLTSHQVMWLM